MTSFCNLNLGFSNDGTLSQRIGSWLDPNEIWNGFDLYGPSVILNDSDSDDGTDMEWRRDSSLYQLCRGGVVSKVSLFVLVSLKISFIGIDLCAMLWQPELKTIDLCGYQIQKRSWAEA